MSGKLLNELKKLNQGQAEEARTRYRKLRSKWEKYGLLEGLDNDYKKSSMALLLENERRWLLKEGNSVTGGAVEGFASVAFPLVRRVFGDLFAEKIVSVQPMSYPTGLVFYLDYVYSNDRLGNVQGDSIYGGDVVGSEIATGVDVNNDKGFYNLNNGYSSPTKLIDVQTNGGGIGDGYVINGTWIGGGTRVQTSSDIITNINQAQIDDDSDILNDGGAYSYAWYVVQLAQTDWDILFMKDYVAFVLKSLAGILGATAEPVRRLNKVDVANRQIHFLFRATASGDLGDADATAGDAGQVEVPIIDTFDAGSSLGTVVGDNLNLEGFQDRSTYQEMAEIEFKVNSLDIRATEKKLKAKWTPELAYDINAYYDVNAEVELTAIMADFIKRDIDFYIINDLIKGGTAGKFYWSRKPGKFVNRITGVNVSSTADYTGDVSHWYETLVETINDLSAYMHRKTLMGGANILLTSPDIGAILEMTNGFRANINNEITSGDAGIVKTGSISKKWDIYISPYFPRNLILVARKGEGFLNSGYVYAPYQPLVATPTIYDPVDLTPRKGYLTRAGFKMVRSDMYGLVIVQDMRYEQE